MAVYDIADIHVQLGQFDEAIAALEQVSEMTGGKEVGVTAALAGAKLALGRQTSAGGFRERSRRAFHGAISLAGEVLALGQGHRPWAWKLVGDACFELASQEPDMSGANESAEVIRPVAELLVADDIDKRSTVEGLGHASTHLQAPTDLDSTLKFAVYAYAYRAYLCKNDRTADAALYDLATALHALAGRISEEEVRGKVLKGAVAAIRLALERDAGDERLWNALGVVCASGGEQVAQHAFVVSLELYAKVSPGRQYSAQADDQDPITWTNLGYLYLRLEDLELANQCFLKAQIIDPDYAKAWLGQGMVTNKNGDVDHSRGLFAHAVTLSAGSLVSSWDMILGVPYSQLEADLAAAASSFERFLRPGLVNPGELHQPAFALKHYVHQRPRDSVAAHLYALICERLGLVDEASAALERAAALLEEEYERSESTAIEIRYSVALCNLGRVRLGAKQYDKALEAFTDCWGFIEGSEEEQAKALRPQVRLGQALSRFWTGDKDSSLEAFEMALEEAEGHGKPGMKEEVAVLLARTLWGLGQDESREMAKSHLMEW